MAEAYTSASQTAAIRDSLRLADAVAPALATPGLDGALIYLGGGGLREVTTLTEAALRRGAARVTCDTDVMLAVLYLAAGQMEASARRAKAEGR